MKIAVLGYSGSGKSTLSKYLSGKYGIPLLYLDTVQFLPNWEMRDREEARSLVLNFINKESWVIDGNYTSFFQEERLSLADKIIYMKFNRFSCLYRGFKRYLQFKNTTRDSMAEGCKEKFDFEFIYWILYKGRNKDIKEHYKEILDKHKNKLIVIKNQRQLQEFKENIDKFI
ncbi:DNA topology modulation protein [Miniphocaeibacter halophilus]|uniref:DNA topology modulation protein n=1 Tax=Miniphocaeibacter halophilus TaxID=2931922 RepID=A0AC61MPL2_9FIRM|nr:DNA topology modulation protein [Miniphocaeibacter halophilus]QQK07352.1 DNA topology modulation protein [Miniphocaeibacter halophilus]